LSISHGIIHALVPSMYASDPCAGVVASALVWPPMQFAQRHGDGLPTASLATVGMAAAAIRSAATALPADPVRAAQVS
jgi:hypothetical protein